MKAIIIKENGGPEKLLQAEVPQPQINDNEVLVKVKAISINPVDTAVRQNLKAMVNIMKAGPGEDYYIPGWDISGTVVDAGKNIKDLMDKDVFGMINFPGQGRAYAEYVAAPAGHLALKPRNITHPEAAAATLAALTAWQALVTHGKLMKGQKVLIHASAGGVGHYAVQIAKSLGARVAGTASSANRSFVMDIGADEFIDYTNERFEEKVRDADLVIDSINDRAHLSRSIDACRTNGRLISIKSYFDDELIARAKAKNLYTERMLVASDGEDMKRIARLLEEGSIKSHISATFQFNELAEAHRKVETGKTRGKVIITL